MGEEKVADQDGEEKVADQGWGQIRTREEKVADQDEGGEGGRSYGGGEDGRSG